MLDKAISIHTLSQQWSEIKSIATCDPKDVVRYWKALITAGTLKYRLCNVEHPGKSDIIKLLEDPFIQSYYIWDKHSKKLTAEFL